MGYLGKYIEKSFMKNSNDQNKKSSIASEISGIIFITLAILSLVSLLGYHEGDHKSINWFTSKLDQTDLKNYAGIIGVYLSSGLFFLFGIGAFFIPAILGILGINKFKKINPWPKSYIIGFLILSLSMPTFLAALHSSSEISDKTFHLYGLTGSNLSVILKRYFGVADYLFIIFFILLGIILAFRFSLINFFNLLKKFNLYLINNLISKVKKNRSRRRLEKNIVESNFKPLIEKEDKKIQVKPKPIVEPIQENEEDLKESKPCPSFLYQLPPLSLLQDVEFVETEESKEDILSYAHQLEDTLANFNIEAKVVQVSKGPVVTRYELQPSSGTKVSSIVSLSDDIALALAALSVRIEAPIPGKQAIGIEIPNKKRRLVSLKEILSSSGYKNEDSLLSLALGKDISGEVVVGNLGKMPHLLVAGTTGSGKSVCINSVITSLLYNASPSQLKLILIDPKRVELSGFNGIPHLLVPVVTDPKRASQVLSWLVTEMEERYELLAYHGVRDIESFNQDPPKQIPEGLKVCLDSLAGDQKLPCIVTVIDELADLMMASAKSAKDCEESITRIAQMARAVGIHLVIATQRPTVNVITGLIKANFPSRIAFQVSSKIDSRTILDMNGAEKLLGQGDMLFLPGGIPKPIRIQCAYLSSQELEAVVNFIKKQPFLNSQQVKMEYEIFEKKDSSNLDNQEVDDELYEKAVNLTMESDQISTSMLQRYLRIGYNRAARLVDMMEAEGIIGSTNGSKPREVLIKNPLERV